VPKLRKSKSRNYWLDLFTGKTWKEFLDAGAEVSGFRESRWTTAQKIRPGDYFICYLTGVSRFIGILEVTAAAYKDNGPIWSDEIFPVRFQVKVVVALEPETALPILELSNELSIFDNLKSPHAWTGRLRGSPTKWNPKDGEIILRALWDAKTNPIKRPLDQKKLDYRPKAIRTKTGPVNVPSQDEKNDETASTILPTEAKEHTAIQYLLAKLGSDMRFQVWIARNDRNKVYNGEKFSELFKLQENLPLQFDEATSKTIELIDVLWLQGNAIVAAFEVEATTAIYSGLLRMSDLIAMQPNLNIPLYLVAPDDRRDKVFTEVNRPTFSRLYPKLSDICRYISFSVLRSELSDARKYIRYLRLEFLADISEGCQLHNL
jgi:hypothetical protein